ncbi:hypothetical protein X907_0361 [Glycocaulis alkaliphilus]|uniref:Uncharacterized protein n=1 Tax=Glycocaulis alkaliphilus TaxID=1434191 RepID=A0A3T0E6I8_9PROT|nr:hypothetical protein X907_0361 [Glycocaulis alkaliphilus]
MKSPPSCGGLFSCLRHGWLRKVSAGAGNGGFTPIHARINQILHMFSNINAGK